MLLERELQETMERKNELEGESRLCEERMNRAFRLVNGLSGERTRWIVTIEDIEASMKTLVGDILISAGTIYCLTKVQFYMSIGPLFTSFLYKEYKVAF